MEIVLVRHGQPEWVADGKNVVNPPLTERGRRQAELTAAELARSRPFDLVVVSPLLRARQTAEPLLDRLRRPEQVEPWLEEIREPDWHGLPAELSTQTYAANRALPAAQRWGGIEGGEPPSEFVARVRLGFQRFLADHGIARVEHELPVWSIAEPDLRIAVVAHAGTNAVLLCHLLGFDPTPWEWDRFATNHASITRVRTIELGDGHTFSLRRLSLVEHLDAQDRTR